MPWHPKVIGLSSPAWRLYVTGICYASRLMTDGFLPRAVLPDFGSTVSRKWRAFAEELVAAGLWDCVVQPFESSANPQRTAGESSANPARISDSNEVHPGFTEDSASRIGLFIGYSVHDFGEYQASAESRGKVTQARSNAGHKGGIRSGEARRKQTEECEANAKQTVEAEETRREETRGMERDSNSSGRPEESPGSRGRDPAPADPDQPEDPPPKKTRKRKPKPADDPEEAALLEMIRDFRARWLKHWATIADCAEPDMPEKRLRDLSGWAAAENTALRRDMKRLGADEMRRRGARFFQGEPAFIWKERVPGPRDFFAHINRLVGSNGHSPADTSKLSPIQQLAEKFREESRRQKAQEVESHGINQE